MPVSVSRGPVPLAALGLAALGAGCDGTPRPQRTLSIVSGSENRSLEPIVQAFCQDEGWACPMTYQGSVDIRLALEDGDPGHDAVWPAHSRWVEMGDRERRVKHLESIMQSPVVFAITFGDAHDSQLQDVATLTRARVFDGRRDLTTAFRHARGYN